MENMGKAVGVIVLVIGILVLKKTYIEPAAAQEGKIVSKNGKTYYEYSPMQSLALRAVGVRGDKDGFIQPYDRRQDSSVNLEQASAVGVLVVGLFGSIALIAAASYFLRSRTSIASSTPPGQLSPELQALLNGQQPQHVNLSEASSNLSTARYFGNNNQ